MHHGSDVYLTRHGVPDPGEDPATTPPAKPGRRAGMGVVVGLGSVSLLTDIASESVAAILPIYITVVVGMGPLAFGFIDGLYQGTSALVRIAGGWWADRSDRPKLVAIAGYGISAVARVGLLISQGFWVITSALAVDRIGKGLRTGPRDALIATASEPEHLGRNFGLHRAMDTTGALIGPLMALALLAAIPVGLGGYHAVFVFSCAFGFLGLLVLILLVPDLRRRSKAGGVRPRLRGIRSPALTRLLLAAGLLGIATVGDGFLYLTLQDGDQVPAHLFPLLFVGTNAVFLALAVPIGRWADRFGRAKVFLLGHLLLLLSYPIAATHIGGIGGLIVVLVLLGTFYAATDGVLAALASRSIPEELRASGISAAQTVVALARFIASLGFGLLWQLTSRSTALWVMTALLSVCLLVSCWLLLQRKTSTPAVAA